MRTFTAFSKKDIEEIVKERLRKELGWIYKEIHRLRIKVNDIDKIIQNGR